MLGSKFSTSLFFLVLLTFFLSPESGKSQDLKYGITAGVNYSGHLNSLRFYTGNAVLDISDPEFSSGLYGGFKVRKELSQTVRLQAETIITSLGVKFDQTVEAQNEIFNIKGKTSLTYLHVPITAHVATTHQPNGKSIYGRQLAYTTFHALGGVYLGSLLNSTIKGSHTGPPDTINLRRNFNRKMEEYHRFDSGIILGGGLEHGYDSKIGVELRAFMSPFSSGKDWPGLNFDPKNLGASLTLYYMI